MASVDDFDRTADSGYEMVLMSLVSYPNGCLDVTPCFNSTFSFRSKQDLYYEFSIQNLAVEGDPESLRREDMLTRTMLLRTQEQRRNMVGDAFDTVKEGSSTLVVLGTIMSGSGFKRDNLYCTYEVWDFVFALILKR